MESKGPIDLQTLPSSLRDIYREFLRRARVVSNTDDRWRKEVRPILAVLAAAGVGPILPFPLLRDAVRRLGFSGNDTAVCDVLVDLRGLVVRDRLGSDQEQVGLFHQTLGECLLDPAFGVFQINAREAHESLVASIDALSPAEKHTHKDPLHRYAEAREADHLWALEQYDRLLAVLNARQSIYPSENLNPFRRWSQRFEERLGRDHPATLITRNNIAHWTGKSGYAPGALRLFQELLPDQERVLGRDHPATLTTRGNIAQLIGETGNAPEALRLFQELLPDEERFLGRDHLDTLTTRINIAQWTGDTGKAREALRLSRELLPDMERVLGIDHPNTLILRNNIAQWTGDTGKAREALRLSRELLPDMERVSRGPSSRDAGNSQQHRLLDRQSRQRAGSVATLPRSASRHGARFSGSIIPTL